MVPQTPTFVAVFTLAALAVSAIKISDASGTEADSLILAVREIGEPCKGELMKVLAHAPDDSLAFAPVNRAQSMSSGVISPDGSWSNLAWNAHDPFSILTRACKASFLEMVRKGNSTIERISLKYGYQDYGYDELGATSDDGYYGSDAYDEGYAGYDGYDELGGMGMLKGMKGKMKGMKGKMMGRSSFLETVGKGNSTIERVSLKYD